MAGKLNLRGDNEICGRITDPPLRWSHESRGSSDGFGGGQFDTAAAADKVLLAQSTSRVWCRWPVCSEATHARSMIGALESDHTQLGALEEDLLLPVCPSVCLPACNVIVVSGIAESREQRRRMGKGQPTCQHNNDAHHAHSFIWPPLLLTLLLLHHRLHVRQLNLKIKSSSRQYL